MEISNELKNLYRHWEKQTEKGLILNNKKINFTESDQKIISEISAFIKERMSIWEKKQKNIFPLTQDEILSNYRFCNIYRELDRQTIELHSFLNPLRNDFDLWFLNFLIHRIIARPETSKKLGFISFDKKENLKLLKKFRNMSSPKFGTPYVFPVSILKTKNVKDREEFICVYLPKNIKKVTEYLSGLKKPVGISEILLDLCEKLGVNLYFHLTEVLIDTAYQFPEIIDLYKPIYVGPGATPTEKTFSSEKVLEKLSGFTPKDFPFLTFNNKKVNLSYENWEGVFREFRKYTNLKKGFGRKRLYKK